MSGPFTAVTTFAGGDAFSLPDSPALRLSQYTVEVWLKADPPSAAWTALLGKPGRNYHLWIHRAGYVHHRFKAGGQWNSGAPNTPSGSIQWNRWHHVALTNDGATARTYIDGELQAEGPVSGELSVDHTTFYVGTHLDGRGGRWFLGDLAELRLWSVARGPEEIRATLHQRLTGREEHLALYWPLSDGTARDLSPNANHGVVRGDPQPSFDSSLPIADETLDLSHPVLSLAGKGSEVLLAEDLTGIGESVTVEVWTQPATPLPKRAPLLHALGEADELVLNVHLPWDGKVYWDAGSASGKLERCVHPIAANELGDEWTHWAFVKDGAAGRMAIYRNASLWHEETGKTRPLPARLKRFVLGGLKGMHWRGSLSELRLWSLARSPEELRGCLHRRLSGREAGLVGYWPLDEEQGTTVHDKTPQGRHGTCTACAWTSSAVPLQGMQRRRPTGTGLSYYCYWADWKDHLVVEAVDQTTPTRRGHIWC